MRELLKDEDSLELLDDILGVKGRDASTAYERIIDEFPDLAFIPTFHKFESVFKSGISAIELIETLYPNCQEKLATLQNVDVMEDLDGSIEKKNINIIMANEIDHYGRCSTFIKQVRCGNASLINVYTLTALAGFLERKFCDDSGQWIFDNRPNQGQTMLIRIEDDLEEIA